MTYQKCRICGKEFHHRPSHVKRGWGKCCSKECRDKSLRIGKFVTCVYCGKEVYRARADLQRKLSTGKHFCSIACHCAWKNKKRTHKTKNAINALMKPLKKGLKKLQTKKYYSSLSKRPDRETLYGLYRSENLTQFEIGRIFNVAHISVQRWLKHYKISIKPRAKSCGHNLNTLKNLHLGRTEESQKKSAEARTIYSKEKIIERIKEFVQNEGRIPSKREFNKNSLYPHHATCRDFFGSWNNAIRVAGYEPNEQWFVFSKGSRAQDGHICDSISEIIIDNWLSKNNVSHKRTQPYPEGRYTCDFVIDDIFVEFFGLADAFSMSPNYSVNMEKKRQLCRKYNIPLIELYEKDLRNLSQALGKKLEQISSKSALLKFVSGQFYKLQAKVFENF